MKRSLKSPPDCVERLPAYGGQALLEGVMMRGSRAVAAAMRAPTGEIIIHTEELPSIYNSKWMKMPFIRGLVSLWDSLGLGMRFLTMSANLQGEEEEKIEGKDLFITLGFSLLIAVAIFFAAPALLAGLLERFLTISTIWGNIIEGVIRLGAVVGYIWLVGKMPEIRRVFAYHGAEHKTINTFEARSPMTPVNILNYSLEHPRCGTAFLLTLVILSVIIFTLFGEMTIWMRLLTRVISIPILAGIAYEYIRLTARHLDHPLVRLLIKPNLALQKLTTREPDESMTEVALAAFQAMLVKERELNPSLAIDMEILNTQPVTNSA